VKWLQGEARPFRDGSSGPRNGLRSLGMAPSDPGDGSKGPWEGSDGSEDGPRWLQHGLDGLMAPTLDLSHLDLNLLLHLFVLDGGVLLLQPARDVGTRWDTRMGTKPPGPVPHS